MTEDVRSYIKTTGMILGLLVVVLALGYLGLHALGALGSDALSIAGRIVVGTMAAALALTAASGLLVVHRARRLASGRGDLFLALNRPRSEAAFDAGHTVHLPFRALRRLLGAPRLLVGDFVRVKSASEIRATLDSSGCLEGLPFMAEMERFCGGPARVFRCVDKVYDYGGKKDFRRLRDVVLLQGLRCDGAAHGGCQAACYVLWKAAWLDAGDRAALPNRTIAASERNGQPVVPNAPSTVYKCQYTEIVASSRPMSNTDLWQYLRPVLAGNITARAFFAAIGTLLFNAAQRLRGGIGYPWLKPSTTTETQSVALDLKVGERVRVKSADDIARTLNKRGRNKGLWFDRDMLKHAGREYDVRGRVHTIINDATGEMMRMQGPCILLEGVDGSGEFMRFCAQHDYLFWREAWLARVDVTPATDTPAPGGSNGMTRRA